MNVRELIADLQQWPGHYEVFTKGLNCSDADGLGSSRRARLREEWPSKKRAKPCVVIDAGWGPGWGMRVVELDDDLREQEENKRLGY